MWIGICPLCSRAAFTYKRQARPTPNRPARYKDLIHFDSKQANYRGVIARCQNCDKPVHQPSECEWIPLDMCGAAIDITVTHEMLRRKNRRMMTACSSLVNWINSIACDERLPGDVREKAKWLNHIIHRLANPMPESDTEDEQPDPDGSEEVFDEEGSGLGERDLGGDDEIEYDDPAHDREDGTPSEDSEVPREGAVPGCVYGDWDV